MQLHQLKPAHKLKKRKRIGRGGKRGTYSGRGIKGQKARAGRKLPPAIRELIKKHPKLRGYRQGSVKKDRGLEVIVNLRELESFFEKEEIVTPKSLIKKGVVSKIKGKNPKVKILAKGKLTKPLTIKGCSVSEAAKKVVEEVGGKVG